MKPPKPNMKKVRPTSNKSSSMRLLSTISGHLMMFYVRRLACMILSVSMLQAAHGQTAVQMKPDSAKGQVIVTQICSACHNIDGNSVITQNPKLTGQAAAYLVKQLNDYAKPPGDKSARENSVMSAFANQLTPEDRRNVAAYFAGQKHVGGSAKNKDTLDRAQQIYRVGIPERNVPACAGCHGPTGAGLPVIYPRLGGQHADYTETQLKAFRDGSRRNNEAMRMIASRLSEAEMKSLADYVAGLTAHDVLAVR